LIEKRDAPREEKKGLYNLIELFQKKSFFYLLFNIFLIKIHETIYSTTNF